MDYLQIILLIAEKFPAFYSSNYDMIYFAVYRR